MDTLKMGTKAKCQMCGKEIVYVGPYWKHTGPTPRHPAWPINKSLKRNHDDDLEDMPLHSDDATGA